MPNWLFPLIASALLSVLIGLVAWIAKGFERRVGEFAQGFDRRLTDFEKIFDERMAKLELILDRGERHEEAIAKMQEEVADLRVNLARWGGN